MIKNCRGFVKLIVLGLFILVQMSCTSSKKIIYFQDLDTRRIDSVSFSKVHALQYGDVLEISVTSIDPEDYQHFTKSGFRMSQDQAVQNAYTVDSLGIISLPYIGSLSVMGLSTMEVKDRVQKGLEPFMQQASVNVRILNLKISVLGDVGRPGTFQMPDMRLALPEALALAGDLTITGKRSEVLLIREQNGQRTYAKLDLRSPDLLSSPYYYLKPNDIIYVEPSRSKIAQNDTRTWQALTFLTTLASLVTILVSRL